MSDLHVRFDAAAESYASNIEKQISAQRVNPTTISVHLGFIQIDHRYHITFTIPKSICEIPDLKPKNKCRSIVCTILEFSEDNDGYTFKLDFKAHKENAIEESLTLRDSANINTIRIVLHATVIGKGKGTPMVRKGVRSIEIVQDKSDSD